MVYIETLEKKGLKNYLSLNWSVDPGFLVAIHRRKGVCFSFRTRVFPGYPVIRTKDSRPGSRAQKVGWRGWLGIQSWLVWLVWLVGWFGCSMFLFFFGRGGYEWFGGGGWFLFIFGSNYSWRYGMNCCGGAVFFGKSFEAITFSWPNNFTGFMSLELLILWDTSRMALDQMNNEKALIV